MHVKLSLCPSILYSISFSVMAKLPPTSYVRLIDIWLINGQLVPFLEVIILTVLELKREGVSAINHHGFARLITDIYKLHQVHVINKSVI